MSTLLDTNPQNFYFSPVGKFYFAKILSILVFRIRLPIIQLRDKQKKVLSATHNKRNNTKC